MATYSITKLSGSTDGKGVQVAATSSPGTTIHTADADAGDIDFVTLFATNEDADGETRTLTLEWGGTTAVTNTITTPVPCKVGLVLLADGVPLMNGLLIKAYADETNDCVIYGFVRNVDN